MICQPNNWNMSQMLEKLSAQANGPTGISNTAPGRCGSNFISVFFKIILWIDIFSTYCEIGLR